MTSCKDVRWGGNIDGDRQQSDRSERGPSIARFRIKPRMFICISTYCILFGVIALYMFYISTKSKLLVIPAIPAQKHDLRTTTKNSESIHIVTASDDNFFPGLPALINSARTSSQLSSRIQFHIVVCGDKYVTTRLKEYLQCYGIDKNDRNIDVVLFEAVRHMDDEMRVAWNKMFGMGRLRSDCNYARAYIHRLLPNVNRIIYVDADIVFAAPIETLWKEAIERDMPLLAAGNGRTYQGGGFQTDTVSKLYFQKYGRALKASAVVFNAGVLVMDLDFYRKYEMLKEVEYWAQEFSKALPVHLWPFDCQSIFQIVYHGIWGHLDHKWNCRGLGRNSVGDSKALEEAGILHWSAPNKPWKSVGSHVQLWESYRPPICSNHGTIENNQSAIGNGFWQCMCQESYTGKYCEISRQ